MNEEIKPPCYILADIDGVLNRHGRNRHENGYNGMEPECVAHFNRILKAVPEARIVIISSWRYDVLSGRMTVAGLEAMMLTHGIDCRGRVVGVTVDDATICGHARSWDWLEANGGNVRHEQIRRWLFGDATFRRDESDCRWVVLDDLELYMQPYEHVRTDPEIGLTEADANRAIAILRGAR